MLLADAEGFWKSPNLYDVAGALGLVIGIVSIWLTWWLAKRDIEKRLAKATNEASEAARQEVRRVARAVLASGIGDTIRSLELAREACRADNRHRALELSELARAQLAKVMGQTDSSLSVRSELQPLVTRLANCTLNLRKIVGNTTRKPFNEVIQTLDDLIADLYRIDGQIVRIQPEDRSDGQQA